MGIVVWNNRSAILFSSSFCEDQDPVGVERNAKIYSTLANYLFSVLGRVSSQVRIDFICEMNQNKVRGWSYFFFISNLSEVQLQPAGTARRGTRRDLRHYFNFPQFHGSPGKSGSIRKKVVERSRSSTEF